MKSFNCTVPAKIEYALLALLELADHTEATPLRVSEIVAQQPIPERYLEQIFYLLRREKLVQSQRGARGGYTLAREPWRITIVEVVQLIEGKDKATSTLERDLISEVWQQAQAATQNSLQQYTLQDLLQRCRSRRQNAPMHL